ncbi:MAG: DNA topoisomerase, partial [Marinobacter sp.]|nr:DNA topoisomerase [Marinobacter sp.]
QKVLQAIGKVAGQLTPACEAADLNRRTEAWNDKKVDAHHAIIPTARQAPSGRLSEAEQKVYELISRYYLMQFSADAIHREGKLAITIGEHAFRATETAVLQPGWKELEIRQREARQEAAKPPLPRLEKGDPILCDSVEITERKTQPPQHFTDATLLSAMTNIARFVSDPELRKTLRETDGLGTEATRAAIIDTLFRRDYLYRDKRHIRSSPKGKALIASLPESISKPDMTAIWEATLESIRRGEGNPKQFIEDLKEQIRGFINAPSPEAKNTPSADGQPHCPKCRAPMRQREGKFGAFHACVRFPDCKGTRQIEDRVPEDGTGDKPVPCPHCFSPLVRRKGKNGWFWGCSNFPGCRQTVDDDNGKPALRLRNTT